MSLRTMDPIELHEDRAKLLGDAESRVVAQGNPSFNGHGRKAQFLAPFPEGLGVVLIVKSCVPPVGLAPGH